MPTYLCYSHSSLHDSLHLIIEYGRWASLVVCFIMYDDWLFHILVWLFFCIGCCRRLLDAGLLILHCLLDTDACPCFFCFSHIMLRTYIVSYKVRMSFCCLPRLGFVTVFPHCNASLFVYVLFALGYAYVSWYSISSWWQPCCNV
jgi:hypothetical protein